MPHTAIRVEGLGKRYRLGEGALPYQTLREQIVRAAVQPVRRLGAVLRGGSTFTSRETFWALRDVSFEVSEGEVLGVVGRNGAGKTTLLKLLSRITEPTAGRAEIAGRVGSLLEVGTGFHPELTGRENVFLNGAILGMKRAETRAKFDRIVEFAEITRFIDTPVKFYSSGMYVRLAFSVAAHLEPHVLLIDEVLAVGDAAFQRKCLGQMENVAREGRTVLFVSHQLSAVRQLCSRAILIDGGRITGDGSVEDVIEQYLAATFEAAATPLAERTDRAGDDDFRFTAAGVFNRAGDPVSVIGSGEPVSFELSYSSGRERLANVAMAIHVEDLLGRRLFALATPFTGEDFSTLPPEGRIRCTLPSLPLVAGEYKTMLWCSVNGRLADRIYDALRFSVVDADVFGSGRSPNARHHGNFIVPHGWRVADGDAVLPPARAREVGAQ